MNNMNLFYRGEVLLLEISDEHYYLLFYIMSDVFCDHIRDSIPPHSLISSCVTLLHLFVTCQKNNDQPLSIKLVPITDSQVEVTHISSEHKVSALP